MTNTSIRVSATVQQLKDADLWDDYCSLTGTTPYAANEGLITPDEKVWVPSQLVTPLLEWAGENKASPCFPIRTKLYLQNDKESNREAGRVLGLSGEALSRFSYALYEVEFDVEIDEDGTCRIMAVDGRALAA